MALPAAHVRSSRVPVPGAGVRLLALAVLCAIVMAACSGDGAPPPEPSAPVIRQVLPERARTDGQVFLVIRGDGFQEGATVQVGERMAGRATWVNAQTLTAVLQPPMDPGELEVRVTNPDGGTAAKPAAMVLEEPPKPKEKKDDGGGLTIPTFDLDDLLDLLDRLQPGAPDLNPQGSVPVPGRGSRGRD